MEAIKTIVAVNNQVITLILPLSFTAKEVEVIVLPFENENRIKRKQFTTIKIVDKSEFKFNRDELNEL